MLFQADEEEALLLLLLLVVVVPCDMSMRIKSDSTKAELVEDDRKFIFILYRESEQYEREETDELSCCCLK